MGVEKWQAPKKVMKEEGVIDMGMGGFARGGEVQVSKGGEETFGWLLCTMGNRNGLKTRRRHSLFGSRI